MAASSSPDDEPLRLLYRLVQLREQELDWPKTPAVGLKRPRSESDEFSNEQPKAKRVCTNVNTLETGNRVKRVLICGVWDMLHMGHVSALKRAKELFPNTFLVVGGTATCLQTGFSILSTQRPANRENERQGCDAHGGTC